MFKTCAFLFVVLSTSLVDGYNYGENQANYGEQQPQIRSGSFLGASNSKPLSEKWTGGQSSPDSQDGSYIIRPQTLRSTTLQRNINFRSADQQSNLRPANVPSGVGFAGNDVASERANQRILTPPNAPYVPASIKDVSLSTVSVQKTEAPTLVQAGNALPLSHLSRLRAQSHSSSPYYRQETLEQMLNRRSADKFLGSGFIQQQLIRQKGEDKFLRVYGKEERELNGTIEVKKGGLVNANLEEVKDGKFSVMDRENRKVGDVSMHRDVEKHLKMTENNGVTNVELEKNSNAELNVERDINLGPRTHDQSSTNPSHKVRVHLEQNQNSRANVEISKNEVQITTTTPDNGRDNGRYRRDVASQLNNIPYRLPIFVNITSLQNNAFVKEVGSVFGKISNAMGSSRGKVCGVLVENSEKYRNKLDQLENKPPIDLGNVMNSLSSNDSNAPTQEEQGKMKILWNSVRKNTLKIMNSLTNRAIVMLKNCTDVKSSDKVYNGPIDVNNSQVEQLPNGGNIIVVDTTNSSSSTEMQTHQSTTSVTPPVETSTVQV